MASGHHCAPDGQLAAASLGCHQATIARRRARCRLDQADQPAITCLEAVLRIRLRSLEAELPGCVLLCVAVPLRFLQQSWPGSP